MYTRPINDLEQRRDSQHAGKLAAECFAHALATRHGFRAHDFSIRWDGGDFDASRGEHEMVVTSNDGRRAAARIADEALLHKDAWKYMREIDQAFARLGRRVLTRGL